LVPTSATLNDLERRNIAVISFYFTELDSFAGYNVRNISSPSYIRPKINPRSSRMVSL